MEALRQTLIWEFMVVEKLTNELKLKVIFRLSDWLISGSCSFDTFQKLHDRLQALKLKFIRRLSSVKQKYYWNLVHRFNNEQIGFNLKNKMIIKLLSV